MAGGDSRLSGLCPNPECAGSVLGSGAQSGHGRAGRLPGSSPGRARESWSTAGVPRPDDGSWRRGDGAPGHSGEPARGSHCARNGHRQLDGTRAGNQRLPGPRDHGPFPRPDLSPNPPHPSRPLHGLRARGVVSAAAVVTEGDSESHWSSWRPQPRPPSRGRVCAQWGLGGEQPARSALRGHDCFDLGGGRDTWGQCQTLSTGCQRGGVEKALFGEFQDRRGMCAGPSRAEVGLAVAPSTVPALIGWQSRGGSSGRGHPS